MQPKISVIIPTYNKANYISQTIESVLNQTEKDFEIIIVDDCSNDNTEKIVQKYLSENIKYFRHNRNWGPGATFNDGIEKSSSEYVTLIASDDILLPNHLELVLDEFKINSDLDVIFAKLDVIDQNGKLKHKKIENTETDKYKLLNSLFYNHGNIFPSPGLSLKKRATENLVFDNSLILLHDVKLNTEIVMNYNFSILHDTTIQYRRFEDNKTNLSAYGKWQDMCLKFEKVFHRDMLIDSLSNSDFKKVFPQFSNVLENTKYIKFLLIKESCLSKNKELNSWGYIKLISFLNDNPYFFQDNVFNFSYKDYMNLYKRLTLNSRISYKKLYNKTKKVIKKLLRV